MTENFENNQAHENIKNTEAEEIKDSREDSSENEGIKEKTESVKETEPSFNLLKEVWEWIYTIGIALLIVFLLKTFVFDLVRVDGPSMNPTLIHNDRLVVTKLGYKPHAGDIVILDANYKDREIYYAIQEAENDEEYNDFEKGLMYLTEVPDNLKKMYYVKRVIALPGDTVDIKNGSVYVNGEKLTEDYIVSTTPINDHSVSYPVTVSDGHVFVMGDNRHNSTDSRSSRLGQVPFEALEGKAQFRLWPFSTFGFLK